MKLQRVLNDPSISNHYHYRVVPYPLQQYLFLQYPSLPIATNSFINSTEAFSERCSVKKEFVFARSTYCENWLTCSEPKGYSQRHCFLPRSFYQRYEQVRSPRSSGVLVEEINSELVYFPGCSVVQQSTSIYQATINTYLLVR